MAARRCAATTRCCSAPGDPSVPDHVALWDTILEIRQGLDLWANLRPCSLLPGVPTPLANTRPEDVDFLVVRENTEGEYAGVGGRSHRGLDSEVALETSVFTRSGAGAGRALRLRVGSFPPRDADERDEVERVALRLRALGRGGRADGVEFGGVHVERVLVDALAARMVRDPASLDVIVASNLFGDILTDLAAAIQGGMGMAASANIAPGSDVPAVFEPVHGSAPDIAGEGSPTPPARSGARRSCSSTWERMRLPLPS